MMYFIALLKLCVNTIVFRLSDFHAKSTVLIKKVFMYNELRNNPDATIMGTRECDELLKAFIESDESHRIEKIAATIILSRARDAERYDRLLNISCRELEIADNYVGNIIYKLNII